MIVKNKSARPANLIREWRKYRDLTLVQLAERTGVSQPTLSRIERGIQPYSQPILEALAEQLNCEPMDLLGRLPGAPSELTVLISKLKPEKVPAAITVLKALTEAA